MRTFPQDKLSPYPTPMPAAFILLLGYIIVWFLQFSQRYPVLSTIRFEFLYGGLLSVLSIIALFRKHRSWQLTSIAGWATLLIALMGLMTFFSYNYDVSYEIYVNYGLKLALFGMFVVALVTTPDRLHWFVIVFLITCGKMGLEGFLGTLDGSMVWYNQGIPRLHGSTPNYMHPNSFSGMALGALPFVYYLFPLYDWKGRVALFTLAVFFLNIILRTGSRTGYVAFALGIAWIILNAKRRGLMLVVAFFVCLTAASYIPDHYLGRAASIFEPVEVGNTSSAGKRKQILLDAVHIFGDKPFGVGVGAFPAIREDMFGRVQDTHNLYLEVATNLGIQGLVVFSCFVFAMMRSLKRTLKRCESLIEKAQSANANNRFSDPFRDLCIIKAIASALQLFVLVRLALGLFGMDLYEIYWWFAAGTAIALHNISLAAERQYFETFLSKA